MVTVAFYEPIHCIEGINRRPATGSLGKSPYGFLVIDRFTMYYQISPIGKAIGKKLFPIWEAVRIG